MTQSMKDLAPAESGGSSGCLMYGCCIASTTLGQDDKRMHPATQRGSAAEQSSSDDGNGNGRGRGRASIWAWQGVSDAAAAAQGLDSEHEGAAKEAMPARASATDHLGPGDLAREVAPRYRSITLSTGARLTASR